MLAFTESSLANTNTQPVTVVEYPDNRLACIRQLGHLSIYTDSQSGRFLLVDDTSNVNFIFNDLTQATHAAMKAHQEMIDRRNRQFFETPGQYQSNFAF